jgi:8-amino-7-oxononanoate synthase
MIPLSWKNKIAKRKENNNLRSLAEEEKFEIDFYSNDYLGLAKTKLSHLFNNQFIKQNTLGVASARLLGGNKKYHQNFETYIAQFYNSQEALYFGSGYMANFGVLQCIASRHDTILYDEDCHASLRDGIESSLAKKYSFKHNNLQDLVEKLKFCSGEIYVVTESIFSMDGTQAPLKELVELKNKYGFFLILDEAHATGLYGNSKPNGLACELQVEDEIFLRIVTFGKALGYHGAAVLCQNYECKQYLINFCRAFIYTTAQSKIDFYILEQLHEKLLTLKNERENLKILIHYFKKKIGSTSLKCIESNSAIQSILIPDNKFVKELCVELKASNIGAYAVLSPTVAQGQERIRIVLHSYNTSKQIDILLQMLNELYSAHFG